MKSTKQKTLNFLFKMTRSHDLDTPHMVANNRQGRKLMAELLKRGFRNARFIGDEQAQTLPKEPNP